MPTVYIETKRLILRSWKDEDRVAFAEINSNENVMRYFPTRLSVAESDAFVDRIMAEIDKYGIGLYAVEIKKTGEFMGYVGFHRFNFNVEFAPGWEIGWRISDKFWHNGFATEAALGCIEYVRKNHLLDKLYSFTAIPNIPSENVMKRIGMIYQGTFMHPALPEENWLREHKLYALNL